MPGGAAVAGEITHGARRPREVARPPTSGGAVTRSGRRLSLCGVAHSGATRGDDRLLQSRRSPITDRRSRDPRLLKTGRLVAATLLARSPAVASHRRHRGRARWQRGSRSPVAMASARRPAHRRRLPRLRRRWPRSTRPSTRSTGCGSPFSGTTLAPGQQVGSRGVVVNGKPNRVQSLLDGQVVGSTITSGQRHGRASPGRAPCRSTACTRATSSSPGKSRPRHARSSHLRPLAGRRPWGSKRGTAPRRATSGCEPSPTGRRQRARSRRSPGRSMSGSRSTAATYSAPAPRAPWPTCGLFFESPAPSPTSQPYSVELAIEGTDEPRQPRRRACRARSNAEDDRRSDGGGDDRRDRRRNVEAGRLRARRDRHARWPDDLGHRDGGQPQATVRRDRLRDAGVRGALDAVDRQGRLEPRLERGIGRRRSGVRGRRAARTAAWTPRTWNRARSSG